MEIKGKVVSKLDVQRGVSKAGKEWSKASIVIETEGQYPKKVMMDNLKKADEFNAIPIGAVGVFQIEVESREYQGRWYSSVSCWNWKLEDAQAQEQSQPQQQTQQAQAQQYTPESSRPTLDALGVKGYQGNFAPSPTDPLADNDLPF